LRITIYPYQQLRFNVSGIERYYTKGVIIHHNKFTKINKIYSKMFQETTKKYFDMNNYAEFILVPTMVK